MNEREAAETNAKIHRLMDTIAGQHATIERLQSRLCQSEADHLRDTSGKQLENERLRAELAELRAIVYLAPVAEIVHDCEKKCIEFNQYVNNQAAQRQEEKT